MSTMRHEQGPESLVFVLSTLNVGGSETKTVRLANTLADMGIRVTIAYLNGPESLLSRIDPRVRSVHLERKGKFSLPALLRLAATLRDCRAETVVAVNLYCMLYAVLARLLLVRRGLRVLATVNTTEFATRKEERQLLLYRHLLKLVDGIVFGARCQAKLWSDRYGIGRKPGTVFVLHNGVDTNHFQPGHQEQGGFPIPAVKHLIGTVGQLRIEKAHVHLLQAVAALRSEGMDVGALLIGDGSQRHVIEGEIERLGIGQYVYLIGEISDVRPYLASMEVFVLCSTAVETFSNAVLEAMSMGCPIVSSRIGGMEEMLEFGGGAVFAPGDVKALTQLLHELLNEPKRRKQLGDDARNAVVEHFSWERMVEKFLRLSAKQA